MSYLPDGQYSLDGVLPYHGSYSATEREHRNEVMRDYEDRQRARTRFCIDVEHRDPIELRNENAAYAKLEADALSAKKSTPPPSIVVAEDTDVDDDEEDDDDEDDDEDEDEDEEHEDEEHEDEEHEDEEHEDEEHEDEEHEDEEGEAEDENELYESQEDGDDIAADSVEEEKKEEKEEESA